MQPIFCRLRRRALRLALLPAVCLLLAALCALPADAAAPAGTSVHTRRARHRRPRQRQGRPSTPPTLSAGLHPGLKYAGAADVKVKVQITGQGGEHLHLQPQQRRHARRRLPLRPSGATGPVHRRRSTNTSGNQVRAQAYSNQPSRSSCASAFLPFLYPNQYVNYSADSRTVSVAKARRAAGAARVPTSGTVTANVYNYVTEPHRSTTMLQGRRTVQSGLIRPTVDKRRWPPGTGICFDYAAVMAAMLQQLRDPHPSRRWATCQAPPTTPGSAPTSPGVGWVDGIIQFDGKSWKLMDPTFASNGGKRPGDHAVHRQRGQLPDEIPVLTI